MHGKLSQFFKWSNSISFIFINIVNHFAGLLGGGPIWKDLRLKFRDRDPHLERMGRKVGQEGGGVVQLRGGRSCSFCV